MKTSLKQQNVWNVFRFWQKKKRFHLFRLYLFLITFSQIHFFFSFFFVVIPGNFSVYACECSSKKFPRIWRKKKKNGKEKWRQTDRQRNERIVNWFFFFIKTPETFSIFGKFEKIIDFLRNYGWICWKTVE